MVYPGMLLLFMTMILLHFFFFFTYDFLHSLSCLKCEHFCFNCKYWLTKKRKIRCKRLWENMTFGIWSNMFAWSQGFVLVFISWSKVISCMSLFWFYGKHTWWFSDRSYTLKTYPLRENNREYTIRHYFTTFAHYICQKFCNSTGWHFLVFSNKKFKIWIPLLQLSKYQIYKIK